MYMHVCTVIFIHFSLLYKVAIVNFSNKRFIHENVGLDIERSINQSLYHYFIVCPNADFTNSPLSLSQVVITGHVE